MVAKKISNTIIITKLKSNKTRKDINRSQKANNKIIDILEAVKKYYAKEKNTIHVNAYERAIYQIHKWPHEITSGKQIAHLEGIGKGMVQKIDTILATGTLPIIKEKGIILESTRQTKQTKKNKKTHQHNTKSIKSEEINDLKSVLGFGEKVVKDFNEKYNVKTIDELKQLLESNPSIKLTRLQTLGLKYHNDLKELISRNEITTIGNKISNICSTLNIMSFLAGSYPSGLKAASKDIDILLVKRQNNKSLSLEDISNKIKSLMPMEILSVGDNKFLGLIKVDENGKWRHLDMKLVDMVSFPYAWLYFSSGKVFNKLIRQKIKKIKKGYKLNEWGLYRNQNVSGSKEEKVILEGELDNYTLENKIKTKEDLLEYAEKIQKEIFKIAMLEYKTITERY